MWVIATGTNPQKYLRRSGIDANGRHVNYELVYGPGAATHFSTRHRAELAIVDAKKLGWATAAWKVVRG